MTRWLDRALSDATRARSLAFAKLRRKKKPSIKGAALRVGILAASVLVCAGLAFVFYPKVVSHPAIRHLFASKSAPEKGKNAKARPNEVVETDPKKPAGDSTGDPSSSGTNPSAPPNGSAKPAQPAALSKEALAFTAAIKGGKLALGWNGDAVKQSGETIKFKVTRDNVVVPSPSMSGNDSADITLTTYGDYSVTVEATDSTGIPRKLDTWGPTTFAPPPAPAISSFEVLVNPEGKPLLRVTIKQPDLSAYGTCVYRVTDPAGVIGEAPADRSEAQECNVHIPLGDRKPADVRGLRFSIRVITAAGDGKPTDQTPLEPPTNVVETLHAKLAAREKHGVYVCALPAAYPTEPVTILDLPWFIDESKDILQLLLLRPKYVVYTGIPAPVSPTIIGEPKSPTRWKCGIEGGSETGSGIGFFEIFRPSERPWCPVLRFVPNKHSDEQTTDAYSQLQMCKLGVRANGNMVGTAQLVEPRQMGPMILAIKKQVDELGYALPRLIASLDAAAIPTSWVPADMAPKLTFAFCTSSDPAKKEHFAVHLRPLDPDEKSIQGYKAWVVAGSDTLDSRSGLTIKKVDKKKVELRISGDWQWKRSDGKEKTKLVPVATDLDYIFRTVQDFEDCRRERDNAAQAAHRAEEEAGKAKDDKKKEWLQKKNDAEASQKKNEDRLGELRPSYESNKPYHDLIVSLTSNDLQISDWTMEWNVSPDAGTEVPPAIPGTLRVVGVVGSTKGGASLRFTPDPKWEAPKRKK